ncbi:hypothetical protein [Williamsia sp. CHRR-6]|uniref:hypothetical protein n=1 Tax=Williamsia sp. CHRR-6 TaxID=2835871 RepID=UPI001BD9B3C0|nr:hypothetical protein [Williamsia sp. CHRR-6]MBT0566376.1 hypothetical protein [Williamsia sp. CHRR-6]
MAVHISGQFTALVPSALLRRPDRVRREKRAAADVSRKRRLVAQRRQARVERERETYLQASRYLLR